MAHLGIDGHRRGRPRWRIDEQSGEYIFLADRWHTCFFDLSGGQGLLGQAEGRTADDVAYWLARAAPAWRDAVRVVATGMCSIYASAVRRMLPGTQIAVDLFHVVHLAVKMTGDVRRRVVRGKYGREALPAGPATRRVRHQEPAGPQPGEPDARPVRQGHGASWAATPAGQEIPRRPLWIAKEKLRHTLNLRARVKPASAPCRAQRPGHRLFAFYDWCACNDDIPELGQPRPDDIPGGRTRSSAPSLTGITNATSES